MEKIFKSFMKQYINAINNDIDLELLSKCVELIKKTKRSGGKVILAGNGGSAADCQHIAAEYMGRLNFDREPLPAISLTANTSNLTCIANDYGYDEIFSRQLKALASENDSLIVYSTSGKSSNIINNRHLVTFNFFWTYI